MVEHTFRRHAFRVLDLEMLPPLLVPLGVCSRHILSLPRLGMQGELALVVGQDGGEVRRRGGNVSRLWRQEPIHALHRRCCPKRWCVPGVEPKRRLLSWQVDRDGLWKRPLQFEGEALYVPPSRVRDVDPEGFLCVLGTNAVVQSEAQVLEASWNPERETCRHKLNISLHTRHMISYVIPYDI